MSVRVHGGIWEDKKLCHGPPSGHCFLYGLRMRHLSSKDPLRSSLYVQRLGVCHTMIRNELGLNYESSNALYMTRRSEWLLTVSYIRLSQTFLCSPQSSACSKQTWVSSKTAWCKKDETVPDASGYNKWPLYTSHNPSSVYPLHGAFAHTPTNCKWPSAATTVLR